MFAIIIIDMVGNRHRFVTSFHGKNLLLLTKSHQQKQQYKVEKTLFHNCKIKHSARKNGI